MEDWEQFFEEKSRRRADKVRRRHAIRMVWRLAAAALLLVLILGILWLNR